MLRIKLYKGIYSRVARRLGVSPSIVARVGSGKKSSERIMQALIEDCRRTERLVEREARKLEAA